MADVSHTSAAIVGACLALFVALTLGACTDPDVQERIYAAKDYDPGAARDHEVTVHVPERMGRAGDAPCSSCHTLHQEAPLARTSDDLTTFHREVTVTHGDLTCTSCHHPDDRDALTRADGRALPFTEVMTLCGQCHGTQYRDWKRGAHGGMQGHWDLARGPRQRNNCIDCHAAHEPAFPAFAPVFAPRDRFLSPNAGH